jgi:hypothetical protein
MFGNRLEIEHWAKIINAEIIGQATYFEYHKRFPVVQRGFVEAYLKDPHLALTYSTILGDIQCADGPTNANAHVPNVTAV